MCVITVIKVYSICEKAVPPHYPLLQGTGNAATNRKKLAILWKRLMLQQDKENSLLQRVSLESVLSFSKVRLHQCKSSGAMRNLVLFFLRHLGITAIRHITNISCK